MNPPKDIKVPKKITQVRHYQQILTGLQVIADLASIILGFFLAIWVYNLVGQPLGIDVFEPIQFSFRRYGLILGVSAFSLIIGFEVNSLYQPHRSLLNWREFILLSKTWITACLLSLAVLYLADYPLSPVFYWILWLIFLLIIYIERYGFFKFNNYLRQIGIIETSVLIYGGGRLASQLHKKIVQTPKLGYHVAGYIHDDSEKQEVQGLKNLGNFNSLKDAINKHSAKKLFIAASKISSEKVIEILNICRETDCKFQVIPSTYEIALERVEMVDVEGVPLISFREPRISLSNRFVKKIFDYTLGIVSSVICFPVFFFSLFYLLFSKKKPLFIWKTKIGRNKKAFKQPSLNAAGTWVEKLGINRYPQLINVFIGNMSLIGPKAEDREALHTLNETQKYKLNVKPGIIGLWEISRRRENLEGDDWDLDIYYIQNQNLILDIIIFLRMIFIFIMRALKKPKRKVAPIV